MESQAVKGTVGRDGSEVCMTLIARTFLLGALSLSSISVQTLAALQNQPDTTLAMLVAARHVRAKLPPGPTRVDSEMPGAREVPTRVDRIAMGLDAVPATFKETRVCATRLPSSCRLEGATVFLRFLGSPQMKGDTATVVVQGWYSFKSDYLPVPHEIWAITLVRDHGVWKVIREELVEIS